jgi:hypothetical protein
MIGAVGATRLMERRLSLPHDPPLIVLAAGALAPLLGRIARPHSV